MKKKSPKTLVNFILDKSGSMSSVREATISGFNEYLGSLKKDKKSDYEFTLTLFDTKVTRASYKTIEDVEELNAVKFNPDGNTALYDAVCSTIRGVTEVKGQKVITIIMTDGQENSSQEYTEVQMKELISEREKKGNWTFVYLGANQDSYATAQKFGIKQDNITNFHATTRGMGASMSALSAQTVAFSASASSQTNSFFSKKDQDLLDKTK